ASKRPDFRQKAVQLGAVGFFEKPYQPTALLAAIEHAAA
ncbi:MAG: LuxR family transcriptional regulator, partial [Verrucomicrobia bacterium]